MEDPKATTLESAQMCKILVSSDYCCQGIPWMGVVPTLDFWKRSEKREWLQTFPPGKEGMAPSLQVSWDFGKWEHAGTALKLPFLQDIGVRNDPAEGLGGK